MKNITLFLLFLWSINSYSQSFYVNTIDGFTNEELQLNLSDNSEITRNICLSHNPFDVYTDIAIDKNQHMYYVSGAGYLYKKNFVNGSCDSLGQFSNTGSLNSLTADNDHFLYACGIDYTNMNELGVLYKYDFITKTFSVLGNIPANFTPSGDLFFYNKRLFLTCFNTLDNKSCILEINLNRPSESCFFMSLETEIYSAFSIENGSSSKAYFISTDDVSTSSLYELDMENRQIGNLIRSYNHVIYGATSLYNLTSTNSSCNVLSNLGFDLGKDVLTCEGIETTLEVKLYPSQPTYPFEWSTGEKKPQIKVKKAGIYWVEVKTPYGTFRDSIEIKHEKCNLDVFTPNQEGDIISTCVEEEIVLKTQVSSLLNSYPIKWNTGEEGSQITVQKTGIYWAELTSPYGVFRDSIEVKDEQCFFIPNTFTPNNDGVNETFYIKGIQQGNWQLQVYDRRGLLVYESNSYKNDWKGDKLPSALYYYRLTHQESSAEYKGWVQILK